MEKNNSAKRKIKKRKEPRRCEAGAPSLSKNKYQLWFEKKGGNSSAENKSLTEEGEQLLISASKGLRKDTGF